MSNYWDLSTPDKRRHFDEYVSQMILAGKKPIIKFEAPEHLVTRRQQNALHKWCGLVADFLNDAGLDMKRVLKPEVDIPWTKESVKEALWKPVLDAMTNKDSTTEMDTKEPDAVYRTIQRHMSQRFGITLPPWPTRHGDL